MKTPMQELIDEAIKYSRKLSTEGYLNESLAVDHIIDLAESLLEKEKEFMQKIYANAKATGEMDEVVRTFNTKER